MKFEVCETKNIVSNYLRKGVLSNNGHIMLKNTIEDALTKDGGWQSVAVEFKSPDEIEFVLSQNEFSEPVALYLLHVVENWRNQNLEIKFLDCAQCGTEFDFRPNKKYCSEKCSAKAKRGRKNLNNFFKPSFT